MLAKRFEEQVRLHPTAMAVKVGAVQWSYADINTIANQIAHQILAQWPAQEAAVRAEVEVVALLFEHGADMIAGTLSAVKAGKVYVPLDPNYPLDRLVYILNDAHAVMLVTNEQNRALAERLCAALGGDGGAEAVQDDGVAGMVSGGATVTVANGVMVDSGEAAGAPRQMKVVNITTMDPAVPGDNLDLPLSDDRVVYLLYTSGSTGRPKGVIQTHGNVFYFVSNYARSFGIGEGDRMTLFSAFSHDAAVMDIYAGLLHGAILYPMSIKTQIAMEEMAEWLMQEEITIYHSVPTIYRYFVQNLRGHERFPHLKKIILGGEKVIEHDVTLFQRYFAAHTSLVNLYGQSESSYNSSQFFTTGMAFEKITLGEPIPGTQFLVLNEEGEEAATFEIGEIFVQNEHLALGYWQDPEKTRKAFGRDPELGRVYRTGDLGRVLLGGSIEFVGRKDFQVKIRGFRVELGEIESALLRYPGVQEAVVIAKTDGNGEMFLCAFVVTGGQVTETVLRCHLIEVLPDYMVPAQFVELEQIPLTPNNKTDRKALQEMEVGSRAKEYVTPATQTEERLAGIVKEIVRVEQVGVEDNLFEIGLHSLRAVTLISRVYKEFHVKPALKQIFQMPTVREMAAWVDEAEKERFEAITPVPEQETYPVSSGQKRLLLLHQLDTENMSYNMPKVLQVSGGLDHARVEKAFREVMARHEALRTAFAFVDGEAVQKVYALDEVSFQVERQQIKEDELPEVIRRFVQPFDLMCAPLFRAALVECGEKAWLLLDLHHIISDGTSMGIFLGDFVRAYRGEELPRLELQYKDFAAWQNRLFASEAFARQEAYWLEALGGEIPALTLPTDYPRPMVMDFAGDSLRFGVEEELTAALQRLAQENGATLYMVLLAAYQLLLSRYSGQKDIVVGTPVAGRAHADLGQMMGMFVNTLALRNQPLGERPFDEFVREVREHALRAFEYQDYPFEMLVEKLDVRRDLSRNPLFDVLFVLQNTEVTEVAESEIRFRFYEFANPTTKFDLALSGFETPDGLRFKLEYRTSLFRRETMERLAGHFVNILRDVVAHPKRALAEVQMLSVEERRELLERWNATETPVEKMAVHELFARQAKLTPDAPALVLGSEVLTYGELDARAGRVAAVLRERGLHAGDVVGLMMRRSFGMLIGLFGVWKAGGAYLPLDPVYPVERLRFMLEDSGAVLVLADHETVHGLIQLQSRELPVLYLNRVEELIGRDSHGTPITEGVAHWDQLAYIIYTSGSTGRPKGVMVEHKSISNTLQWRKQEYHLTHEDRVLQLFSFAFDGFLTSCLTPLIAGAAVILLDEESAKDPLAMRKVIVKEQVTHWIAVPSLYSSMLDCLRSEDMASLRVVTLAGEAVPQGLVQRSRMLRPELELVNEYGPTENSVVSTFMRGLEMGTEITIGGPVANTQVYLLDHHLEPVPVGVMGEICVSGQGLARGYVNLPEITAERFVAHPFRTGERLYRTGDLGRRRADGRIEFVGRIDEQVKIRGFRIELGEIEAAVTDYPGVKEAVVLKRDMADGSPYLVAYYVAEDGARSEDGVKSEDVTKPKDVSRSGDVQKSEDAPKASATATVTSAGLRMELQKKLPAYMIPTYFVQLEKMPLTPNGKVDRNGLPAPGGEGASKRKYVAPTDEVEAQLAAIWSEVLGVAQIGIEDHFFELGGHSLKATALVAKVYQRFHVELPLREVFQTPTVKELAHFIRQAERKVYLAIEQAAEQQFYPLSSAQKRMFALQQLMEGTTYNMPGVFYIEGSFDPTRFEAALQEMIRRHASLRTSFVMVEGEPVQRIEEQIRMTIRQVDGRVHRESGDLSHDESTAPEQVGAISDASLKQMVSEFIQPFDLSHAPLLRVQMVNLGDRYLLMYDMHHIISDGLSMEIFMNEWFRLYAGQPVKDLRIQYKDFAVWQNQYLQSEALQREEAYWLATMADEVPVLNLPTDFPRPSVMGTAGDRLGFALDETVVEQLHRLTAETNTTLFMVLLAAYNLFLAKYTGQDDFVVGTPIAGRPHADLENVIGIFVNTLALRNRVSPEMTFLELLGDVRENALKAFEHQNYQFEMLVERLHLERDLSRNPLFDTMFALQSRRAATNDTAVTGDLRFRPYAFENKTAKFDLSLNMVEGMTGVYGSFEFSTDLFRRETVERMARHFVKVLQEVVANPAVLLSDVEILTDAEKAQQLYEWNATSSDYDRNTTVMERIAAEARKTPDAVALICTDRVMTYREMDQRATALAMRLHQQGIGVGDVVALLAERSFEMIIGILGVLKAGGCYLPIDPKYPNSRIEYMLQDSAAAVLLAQSHLLSNVTFAGTTLRLDEYGAADGTSWQPEAASTELSTTALVGPTDLAYMIYTSGSTGNPKGVMVEHRNVSAYLHAFLQEMQLTANDTAIQQASYAFDASVEEIFAILSVGGRLVLPDEEDLLDLDRLAQIVERHQVTIMSCPPLILNEWNQRPPLASVRIFINSGDVLKAEYITNLVTYAHVYNVYGPTETTIAATFYRCPSEALPALPPIGQPIANYRVYIMDQAGHMLPQGVPGEICIAGDGVARGYLNREDLTADKFLPEPLATGQRMYRTGDLGKWLADGTIEFLGRIDHQVKIRGFRIELGEVEAQLMRLAGITEALVMDRTDVTGNKYLCAYFVADRPMEQTDLREQLVTVLPHYMIPAYWIQLEQMPVTVNGKIDRRALPIPDASTLQANEYVQPVTEAEAVLAKIWADVLRVEPVGIQDNFFTLGGDSIKAIQILARANQQGIYLTVKDIFKYGTIASLLENVDFRKKKLTISQAEVEGEVLLTPIQLWFFEQNFSHPQYYTQSNLFSLRTDVDVDLLEQVLRKLIAHHDALRMTVRSMEEDGRWMKVDSAGDYKTFGYVQHNRKVADAPFTLQRIDLTAEPYAIQREQMKEICVKMQDGFDLVNGLPIQAAVFDLGPAGLRLFITIHHMVVDGVSWRIILEDLQNLYNSGLTQPLPPKTTSYQDWAHKLTDYVRMRKVDLDYWQKIDATVLPTLVVEGVRGAESERRNCFRDYQPLAVSLSVEETGQLLTQANWAYNTEINDLLLAALALAMDEALSTPQVLLTLEGHGREEMISDVDISRTVGWFTSAYPVYFEAKESIEKTIKHVKESLRRIPEKGVNFGLARYLGADPHLRNLNPEITFNYLGQFDNVIADEPADRLLSGAPESSGPSVHPDNENASLLDITGAVAGGRLQITLSYNANDLDEERMHALQDSYQRKLSELVAHCCGLEEQSHTASDFGLEAEFASEEDFELLAELYDMDDDGEGE